MARQGALRGEVVARSSTWISSGFQVVVNQPLQGSGKDALRLRCDWLSSGADRRDDLRRVWIFEVVIRMNSTSKASRNAAQKDSRASKTIS